MKKLFLATLVTAALGCNSGLVERRAVDDRQGRNQYSHEFYIPEQIEQSKQPVANVYLLGFAYALEPKTIADILTEGKKSKGSTDWEQFNQMPFSNPVYLATKLSFPHVCVELATLRERTTSGFFKLMYEGASPDWFTLTKDSTQTHIDAIEELVENAQWTRTDAPSALVGSGEWLVIEIQKGHDIERCPTGEHVLNEEDYVAVKNACLVSTDLRILKIHVHPYGTNDRRLQADIRGGPVDTWKEHYVKKHTRTKKDN